MIFLKRFQKNVLRIQKNSIKHYHETHNTVPFWILIDHLAFCNIIYFFKYQNDKIRNAVSKDLLVFLKENITDFNYKDFNLKLLI